MPLQSKIQLLMKIRLLDTRRHGSTFSSRLFFLPFLFHFRRSYYKKLIKIALIDSAQAAASYLINIQTFAQLQLWLDRQSIDFLSRTTIQNLTYLLPFHLTPFVFIYRLRFSLDIFFRYRSRK